MSRPPKLDTKQIANLAQDIERGVSVPILAATYGVTTRYVYKFKRELVEEKALVAKGIEGGDSPAIPPKRLDSARCNECKKSFDRYVGENRKFICSGECYRLYTAREFPSKTTLPDAARWVEKSCPAGTSEFQAATLGDARRFFPELDFSDETLPDYLIA